MALSGQALALEPCDKGVPAIDIVQGAFVKAPGYISPDTQSVWPNGKLKEQGWHNLKKAQRPLSIVCRYADKAVTRPLPDSVDSCVFSPGHVSCE